MLSLHQNFLQLLSTLLQYLTLFTMPVMQFALNAEYHKRKLKNVLMDYIEYLITLKRFQVK